MEQISAQLIRAIKVISDENFIGSVTRIGID